MKTFLCGLLLFCSISVFAAGPIFDIRKGGFSTTNAATPGAQNVLLGDGTNLYWGFTSNLTATATNAQPPSTTLTNITGTGAITNANADSFALFSGAPNNSIIYLKVGFMGTNADILAFTNRGFTLLKGNTIVATNGWFQIGDGVNKFIVTNFNLLRQVGGMLVPVGSITSSNMSDFYEDANLTVNGLTTVNGLLAQGTLHNQGTLSSFDQDLTIGGPLTANGTVSLNGGASAGVSMSGLTASRALVLNGSKNVTNAAGTPDGTKFLRDDNTYAVPPGAGGVPGGSTPQVQFNQGGTFAGTNDYVFDRNIAAFLIGFGNITAGGGQLILTNNTTGLTLTFKTQDIVQSGDNSLGISINGADRWVFKSSASGNYSLAPNLDNTSDLGILTLNVRTGYIAQVRGSNIQSVGAGFINLPRAMSLQATQLIADGTVGNYFTNTLASTSGGLTNIAFTNMLDGQLITVQVFPSNGVTAQILLGAQTAPSNWFFDGNSTLVSNAWNIIEARRIGNYTNLLIHGPTLQLVAGANITLTTNFAAVPQTLTIASTGGGTGAGVVQWQTNNVIVNVGQTNISFWGYDIFISATNNASANKVDYAFYGKTNFNIATFGTEWLTNQLVVIPANLNGSNGVSAIAVTNMFDFTVNTYRSFTNVIGTNQTCIFTNIVGGGTIFATFIGINGYTNNMFIQSQPGTVIKWINWNTNPQPDILVRPNQTYWVTAFGVTNSTTTNIEVSVGSDDPYIPAVFWSANISNLVVSNLLVQAGGSTSNYVMYGNIWWSTNQIANPTSNGTLATVITIPIGANVMTNVGDSVPFFFDGVMPNATAGTNELAVLANNGGTSPNLTIFDSGLQTASNTTYTISGKCIRTGTTSHHWQCRLEWGPGGGVPFVLTNINSETTTTTNGLALNIVLQATARRQGSLTNTGARAWLDAAYH